MKLGIMQPYFFPYPGYFQLIAHCDTFVFYDDVQFIKGGWINRNRILCDDQPKWFTYPINSGSTFANICERYYVADTKSHAKLRNQLESSYRDATFFGDVIQLFQLIMEFPNKSIAEFNINLIRIISEHIGLKTNFLISSKLSSDKEFCGQERVLEIARLTKAKTYINPIGGTNLYNKQTFSNEGVDLQFIKPDNLQYDQDNKKFVPMLSVLDFLMFCPTTTVKKILESNYSIID